MAVPRKKVSKSRRGMRRSHDHIPVPTVVICSCGEPTLPHRICPSCGAYRDRTFISVKEDGEK